MLNPDYFNNSDVQKALTDDGIAVLDNILLPDKAEALYTELTSNSVWHREHIDREGEDGTRFVYKRNRIQFDSGSEGESLTELREFLRSDTCLDWVTLMSGLSCFDVEGSAASMSPGDFLGRHNDDVGGFGRVIAYVLYLTKDWQEPWGGELVFEPKNIVVAPSFNKLVMFRVNKDSFHHVNKISEGALSPRLNVVGWFNKNTQRAKGDAHKIFKPNWEMPKVDIS